MAQFTGPGLLKCDGSYNRFLDLAFDSGGIDIVFAYQAEIAGCFFTGSSTGITLSGSMDAVLIHDNRVESNQFINFNNNFCSVVIITDNVGYAGNILGVWGENVTISGNRFLGGGDIIVNPGVYHLIIDGNDIEGTISVTADPNDFNEGARIANNYIEAGHISVTSFNEIDIVDNWIKYPAAACIILAGECARVTVKDNRCDDHPPPSPGVTGVDIQDSTVVDTWVVLNRFGPGISTPISDSGTNTSTAIPSGTAGANFID